MWYVNERRTEYEKRDVLDRGLSRRCGGGLLRHRSARTFRVWSSRSRCAFSWLPSWLAGVPSNHAIDVAKRFRLVGAVWYGAFGTLTGLSVAVIFSFALGTEVTSVAYVTFIFAASGAAAGLMYRWVERQESDYRNRRHQTKQ